MYPILLAAIVGNAMEVIATWIAEHGGRLFVLEQLMGSTTIFGAIKTQILTCIQFCWGGRFLLLEHKLHCACSPRLLSLIIQQIPYSARQIRYQSREMPHTLYAANCTVEFSNVENRIRCEGTNCSVTHIRRNSASAPTQTPLEGDCQMAQDYHNLLACGCK
jgi:hypothetical protein